MDRIGAVAMFLFGVFWAWVGSGYSMTSRDGGPGAGVLPTALGVIIAALALASFFRPEVDRIKLPQFGRILIILGALAGYALLLEPLGYVVATALLLGVLLMAQLTLGVLTVLWRKPADLASAHVAVGALVLVTAFVLAVRAAKLYVPARPAVRRGFRVAAAHEDLAAAGASLQTTS